MQHKLKKQLRITYYDLLFGTNYRMSPQESASCGPFTASPCIPPSLTCLSPLTRVVVNASGAPVLWRVNEEGFLRSSILNGTTMCFLQAPDGLVVPDHSLPLGQNYFLSTSHQILIKHMKHHRRPIFISTLFYPTGAKWVTGYDMHQSSSAKTQIYTHTVDLFAWEPLPFAFADTFAFNFTLLKTNDLMKTS